jgi:hypothetical protein
MRESVELQERKKERKRVVTVSITSSEHMQDLSLGNFHLKNRCDMTAIQSNCLTFVLLMRAQTCFHDEELGGINFSWKSLRSDSQIKNNKRPFLVHLNFSNVLLFSNNSIIQAANDNDLLQFYLKLSKNFVICETKKK